MPLVLGYWTESSLCSNFRMRLRKSPETEQHLSDPGYWTGPIEGGYGASKPVLKSSTLGRYIFGSELLRCFVVPSVTLKLDGTNSVVSADRTA